MSWNLCLTQCEAKVIINNSQIFYDMNTSYRLLFSENIYCEHILYNVRK